MKKTILTASVAMLMMSCGMLQQPASTATPTQPATTATTEAQPATPATPTEAGQAAATALQSLYAQYKADGKYDFKNINNITNSILLLANCAELPSNAKNASYLKDFGVGMMANAPQLITEENVESVTNNLTTMAGKYADKAASATATAAEKLSTAAATASSIANLLTIFQK